MEISSQKKEVLEKTAKEYFLSAEEELAKERYNSSVVLFFKALVAMTDLYILQETGNTPSSHNERFRTAQEKFPEVYNLLDKDFPLCQKCSRIFAFLIIQKSRTNTQGLLDIKTVMFN